MYKYFVLACMLALMVAGAFYAGHKFSLARLGLDVLEGLTVGLPDREQKEFESKVKPLDANLADAEQKLRDSEKKNALLEKKVAAFDSEPKAINTNSNFPIISNENSIREENTNLQSASRPAAKTVNNLTENPRVETNFIKSDLDTANGHISVLREANTSLRAEISNFQQVNSLLKKENSLFKDRVNQLIGRRLRHGPGTVIGYDPFRGSFTVSVGWAISWS